MRKWLDIMYAVVAVALILWIWQRRKSRRQETTEVNEKGKKFFIWSVALAMIAAGAFLALGLSDSNWKVQYLNASEVHKLIADDKNKDLQFSILQYQNGRKYFLIKLLENGKLSKFDATVDDGSLALLKESEIACPTYVQGRDFEIFGWQGKLLMGLFLFILAAGAAVFLTLSLKNKSKTPIMTKGTKIGIVAAVVLAALIITPLVWLNHRKVNSVRPNQIATQALTSERAAQAKQTAKDFFEALGKGNWNKVDKLCPPGFPLNAQLDDQTKNMLNGLTLVSLGEPFTKPPYPGVFVPYEIRFTNGDSKKYNLAVRQDNPEQKWYWDGGL